MNDGTDRSVQMGACPNLHAQTTAGKLAGTQTRRKADENTSVSQQKAIQIVMELCKRTLT